MPGTALSPRARMLRNTVSISASQLVASVPWLSTASATKNKRNGAESRRETGFHVGRLAIEIKTTEEP
jgi:hypothetical protein